MPAWATARPRLPLPRGRSLPEPVWQQRHRFMMGLGAAHVVGLPLFGLYMGEEPSHVALEGLIIACLLGLALVATRRSLQATFASLALVSSSAILVHFSGGYIEAHFHFFVSLAFITLYQEWLPFAATVFMTVVHHGVVGAIDPGSVYNHPAALADPWTWAVIHGLFVFAASAAYVVQWRLNEDARDETHVVLDAAGDAIVGVDPSRRITFANRAAEELFGARYLVGRPIATFVRSCNGLDAASRHTEETELVGHSVPVQVVSTPVVQGASTGHVMTIIDVTRRQQAEEERLRHRDEQLRRLRELDELKTSFINTVAHELRTPMTPLRLQAGLLRRLSQEPATQRAADMLDRNLQRLHRLVDDVLDVTRLQAGRLSLETQQVDLREAIEDAVEFYEPVAQENGVTLIASCPQGLTVEADPMRLSQMLHNLIANGVRCAPGGRVEVTAAEDDHLAIRVTDDGVGLNQDQVDRLFRPFGQIQDGAPEQRQGTGLGLFLTRELARLHGGDVTVASPGPGRGATVTVSLPLPKQPLPVVMVQ